MSDQLRFGLIGTGWIGRFHAESLARRVPDATLVAVADPNVEAAQSIGARSQLPSGLRIRRAG
ncbi:Gfo/Idh/MocA family oxidoreductase [Mycobacterium sp. LTG2003]